MTSCCAPAADPEELQPTSSRTLPSAAARSPARDVPGAQPGRPID
ncbi:hypothetical protein ACU063_23655 [Paenibacillus sp. M.A.Huq-81]